MPIIAIYFLKKTFFPLSFENQPPQHNMCVNKLSAVKCKNFQFHEKKIVNKQLYCIHTLSTGFMKTVSG